MTTEDLKENSTDEGSPKEGTEGVKSLGSLKEERADVGSPWALWMPVAVAVLASVAVTIGGLLIYGHFGPKALRIATLDINEIMQIKQLQVTTMATHPGATTKDQEAAYAEITRFGQEIEGAINEMQQECQCLILVRAAVIKGADDLTGTVKQKLGMGNVSVQSAMDSLTGHNSSARTAQAAGASAPGPAGSTPSDIEANATKQVVRPSEGSK